MWKGEDLIVFDLERSSQDHINYEVIEQLKNGRFNSTKYESTGKVTDQGKHVKMIVFTNEEPDKEKLSPDRWDVVRLTEMKTRDDTGDKEEPPQKRQRSYIDEQYDMHQEQ